MPEITTTIPNELHAKLTRWADEANRPLSELVADILSAGQHARDLYDPTKSDSARAPVPRRRLRILREVRTGARGRQDGSTGLFGIIGTYSPHAGKRNTGGC